MEQSGGGGFPSRPLLWGKAAWRERVCVLGLASSGQTPAGRGWDLEPPSSQPTTAAMGLDIAGRNGSLPCQHLDQERWPGDRHSGAPFLAV